MDRIHISGLEVPCIIGTRSWERQVTQRVTLDLEVATDVRRAAAADDLQEALDYRQLCKTVVSTVEGSSFQLLETLAETVAQACLDAGIRWVRVRVGKPGALRGAREVAVDLQRGEESGGPGVAYLGLGSNQDAERSLGGTMEWLRRRFEVRRSSGVYQGAAQGPPGQPDFLNLVVEVATRLDPFGLQAECHAIEAQMGRRRGAHRHAPRTCDIDLLLLDDRVLDAWGITLPHPKLLEAPHHHVPLCALAPDVVHPVHGLPLRELVAASLADHHLQLREDLHP